MIDGYHISSKFSLRLTSLDFSDDKSTLVQLRLGAVKQQAITWTNVDLDPYGITSPQWLKPKQNVQLCAGNMLKLISIYKKLGVLTPVLLKFVPNGPINNKQMLVKIVPWCQAGNKPLTETMMA